MQLAQAFRRLEAEARRITPQREGILRLFAAHPDAWLSAEEVRLRVRAERADIGLATVYRTLELLTSLRVLRRREAEEGGARYGWNPDPLHRAPQLVCTRCGRAQDYPEDPLEGWEAQLAGREGFQVTDHEVRLLGICRDCGGPPTA